MISSKVSIAIGYTIVMSLIQMAYGDCTACTTSCSVNNNNPPPYNSDHIGIGDNMDDVCLPGNTVIEENEFKCYKHSWCNNDDGCKLKERPTTGPTCNWNLITSDNVDSPTVVYAQSPKHSCSSKNRYYNRLFCVYNISLPACADSGSGGVRITFDEDEVDIQDNSPCKDYVQIVGKNGKFQKICGDYDGLSDTQKQFELAETNFLLVFFSDKTTKDEGFSLKTECRY